MLALELAELSGPGYDLALTGFDDARSRPARDDGGGTDDAPTRWQMPTNRTLRRRAGCRWCRCPAPAMFGPSAPHRLICGDATDPTQSR